MSQSPRILALATRKRQQLVRRLVFMIIRAGTNILEPVYGRRLYSMHLGNATDGLRALLPTGNLQTLANPADYQVTCRLDIDIIYPWVFWNLLHEMCLSRRKSFWGNTPCCCSVQGKI